MKPTPRRRGVSVGQWASLTALVLLALSGWSFALISYLIAHAPAESRAETASAALAASPASLPASALRFAASRLTQQPRAHIPGPLTALSWSPRAFLMDGFLSHAECDILLGLVRTRGFGSVAVYTSDGGAAVLPGTVSSSIATLGNGDHPLVATVESRLAALSQLPVANGEPLHVIRYSIGAYFRGHMDAHVKDGMPNSGRVATALIYLLDGPADGSGETLFPLGVAIEGDLPPGVARGVSANCATYGGKDRAAQGAAADSYLDGSESPPSSESPPESSAAGFVVRPRRGRALLWWSRRPDLSLDLAARHAGCPLRSGEKFVVTKWLRQSDAGVPRGNAYGAGGG